MSAPTVTVEQVRHTVTVEDSGQRIVVPNEIVRIITAGTQGPPGPPSLSPDGIITTEGGIIVGGSGGTPAELAVGADAHALVSNGITRVNRRLAAWDVTWSGATAYAFGTAYASMTDSAAAITAAITQAKALGLPVVGRGQYRVDSTIEIDTDADFTGAHFVCNSGTQTLLRLGTDASGVRIERLRLIAPTLTNAFKTGLGWAGNTSIGLELANLQRCTVWAPFTIGFENGIKFTSYGAMGTAYNELFIGQLYNNKRQLWFKPGSATGWTNENTIYGGSFAFDAGEGTDVAGARHILIEGAAASSNPNNNLFIRPALEGNVPEYHLESIGGRWNRVLQGRWEATTPKVWWNQADSVSISQDNEIDGGYNAGAIVVTNSANSTGNDRRASTETVIDGIDANGVVRIRNRFSSGLGCVRLFDTATNPDTAGANDWTADFSAGHLRGKPKASTDPVVRINFLNQTGIEFGPGNSATLDTNLRRFTTNALTTDDAFWSGKLETKTAAYTATNADQVILCNATTAAFTITLPTAVGIIGKTLTIKKTDLTANAVTVDANGIQTIDGALTKALGSQWAFVTLVSDGANWLITAQGGTVT